MKFFALLVFHCSIPLISGLYSYEENRIYPKDSYGEQYSDMSDVIAVESGNI